MNLIEKMVINAVIGTIKEKLGDYMNDLEEKDSKKLKDLITNLYTKSISDFMKWGIDTLTDDEIKNITIMEYLKYLIEPVEDDIEGIINRFIDGLDPRLG